MKFKEVCSKKFSSFLTDGTGWKPPTFQFPVRRLSAPWRCFLLTNLKNCEDFELGGGLLFWLGALIWGGERGGKAPGSARLEGARGKWREGSRKGEGEYGCSDIGEIWSCSNSWCSCKIWSCNKSWCSCKFAYVTHSNFEKFRIWIWNARNYCRLRVPFL